MGRLKKDVGQRSLPRAPACRGSSLSRRRIPRIPDRRVERLAGVGFGLSLPHGQFLSPPGLGLETIVPAGEQRVCVAAGVYLRTNGKYVDGSTADAMSTASAW